VSAGQPRSKASHLEPIHPFPARMAPRIAHKELASRARCTVLDPMSGSGTTLATARLLGHRALGFDSDPLAVLLAQGWCADVDRDAVRRAGQRALGRAKHRFDSMGSAEAYPPRADAATKKYVRYWFSPKSRRQLVALASSIARVRDNTHRTVLWCAFSRLIITKDAGASLARDVSHSRPHRKFKSAPRLPFDYFSKSVDHVVDRLPFDDGRRRTPAKVRLGDARKLPLRRRSVDIVITSPPYLNALDYMRGHRLTLVWMGDSVRKLRDIRAASVGAETGLADADFPEALRPTLTALKLARLDSRHLGMLRRYVRDISEMTSEISRVLRPGGRAILVIGDSTLRGVAIRNSMLLQLLAEKRGLRLVRRRTRTLPENRRYLPPPGSVRRANRLRKRMRREVILEFKRRDL
jgi:SAM-dependent methyltransferase